jgi:hypothetical protein
MNYTNTRKMIVIQLRIKIPKNHRERVVIKT